MLTTVLFDMGGTLEDIWNNKETQAEVMAKLQETLRAHGLEPDCDAVEFDRRVMAGLKAYKNWSEPAMRELKPEEIWPDFYLKEFGFDREKLEAIAEELANLWEAPINTGSCAPAWRRCSRHCSPGATTWASSPTTLRCTTCSTCWRTMASANIWRM